MNKTIIASAKEKVEAEQDRIVTQIAGGLEYDQLYPALSNLNILNTAIKRLEYLEYFSDN